MIYVGDFKEKIEELTREFVGREWLFGEVVEMKRQGNPDKTKDNFYATNIVLTETDQAKFSLVFQK